VVNGDFQVVDYRRRNRNFKIIRRNYPSYFVKQVQSMEAEPVSTLQREANCYWLAQTQAGFAPLARIMPKYVGYDPARHVLIIELLAGAETLSEYYRRLGGLPETTSASLGKLIGGYHREPGVWIMDSQHNSLFARAIPWILSIHQMRPEYFRPLSGGNAQLLQLVQSYPEFHETLDALRSEWQVNSLLHGDMKWENCLVQSRGGGRDGETLKLIDWEMADLGDACWDAGALLQNFLVFWTLSLPLEAHTNPAQAVHFAQFPLDRMQPAIRSFWRAYTGVMELDTAQSRDLLLRSVRFGAARMIQSAFECLYFSPQMTPQAICLLQMSLNILQDPARATKTLLGL
jgi:hypothetical protein